MGDDLTIVQGYAAAREGAINLICALKAGLGDLDRVGQIVKPLGFVRCTPEFGARLAVINGASGLLAEVFGSRAAMAGRRWTWTPCPSACRRRSRSWSG